MTANLYSLYYVTFQLFSVAEQKIGNNQWSPIKQNFNTPPHITHLFQGMRKQTTSSTKKQAAAEMVYSRKMLHKRKQME